MKILYITYIDFNDSDAGSFVRPVKLYRALLSEGHEVRLLAGDQSRDKKSARLKAVAETNAWLDDNTPDICYIESPVYPILWSCDRALIRRVHRMGVPIGYFYRDFYWMFPELYPKRTDPMGRIKDAYLALLQRKTDRLLRCADIVYFPSHGAARLFSYKDMRALPPAGEDRIQPAVNDGRTCIYVGGMKDDYGGTRLLEAFRELNAGGTDYPLLLVCRAGEWEEYAPEWEREPWLEVHHVSGAALEPLYRRASLAVFPVDVNPYTDLSVNVKLFEYMGYGLPVAATGVEEISRLIRENGLGRAGAEDSHALAEMIREMLSDSDRMEQYRESCARALRERHLWIHRARQVVRELEEKR